MSPKKLIYFFLLLAANAGFSQSVSIEDDLFSSSELVNILLESSCLEVSNINISSNQSVAYFNNQGGDFPISEGIIIRSGEAEFSEGTYTDSNLSSQLNNNGDAFLEQLNLDSGQSPIITDVAYMDFEFIPLSSSFSFDFLFASNEYGAWQCVSSDIFAFLLTDLITGNTINLAVIPATGEPVSVRNIKDNLYNPSCQSDSPELFSTYNVDNPSESTINMRGHTVVLNASSEVIVGNPYKIRLVIGDSQDALYDSAIFLAAGSFSTSLNLGEDQMICDGDVQVLETNLNPLLYLHTWTKNGEILVGETGNSLSVNEPGHYGVSVLRANTACSFGDEILFSDLMVQTPPDLVTCDTEEENEFFDLTNLDATDLGLDDSIYDLIYYASLADIDAENPIPNGDLTQYESPGGESIFIKLHNQQTGNTCNSFYTVDLVVSIMPEATTPDDMEICESMAASVNLEETIPQILNGLNQDNFNFYFFLSENDAELGISAIPISFMLPDNFDPVTIWVRMQDSLNPNCYDIVSFEVIVRPEPIVDSIPNVVECSSFELPPIENGNYYTGSNGTGIPLFAGDIIEESGTYYIFNGPNEFGCINQSNFNVFLASDYEIGGPFCGEFLIPLPPLGSFYTSSGGPLGGGVLLPPGTVLNSSQTIYYYAELDGEICRDEAFDVVISNLPAVDDLGDVITCGQYILPALTTGNYFSQENGNGLQLNANDVITSSQDIYIFEDDSVCSNQSVFHVSIIPEFSDIDACGTYTLPALEVGGYFTEALGQGQQIPEGTIIDSSQTIYFYVETTTQPNCAENLSFHIDITHIEVDQLEDVLLCEGDFYELPPLVNGSYFTGSEATGNQLFPGDFIENSQTVYIYNTFENCFDQTSFFVEIRPLPEVDHFTDIHTCSDYMLPILENGSYYSEPGGNGTPLSAGTVITENQTLYIYSAYPDFPACFNQDEFTIYFDGIDVGTFEDVTICDEYIVPQLFFGNYYTQSDGQGEMLEAGDVITSDTEIFVYAENGERFICTSEDSFFVNISETPNLPFFPDVESCGSYTLPELSQEFYNVAYYWEPNGQNEIENHIITQPGTYSIYVYASAFDNINCDSQTKFTLRIYSLLNLEVEGGYLCRNLQTGEVETPAYLNSGLDPSEFTVNWYFQDSLVFSGPEFEAFEPGIYTVETIKLNPETGADCNYAPTTVEVLESATAIASAEVSQPFLEIAVITVKIEDGIGIYEYQLDNGNFHHDNEFYDVESGFHTITIRGLFGNCGETILEVEVIKHPKFFTPNGDGHNETWNIRDLQKHPEAKIHIFDRYGKLLSVLTPQQEGWNGLYNGRPMPSDDYWFKVEFIQDGKTHIFKSHFTLTRY
ncbi:MAG TPA: choice-of-anchor L domain-containing protein [Flavobacteriaceae bacterium]|nr:choice-of-anchor L domain-containing protein [Flavobacteriaceae bacterium]